MMMPIGAFEWDFGAGTAAASNSSDSAAQPALSTVEGLHFTLLQHFPIDVGGRPRAAIPGQPARGL